MPRSPELRKLRDRAMALPLVGIALLTPPVASAFHLGIKIAGIPFTLLYLFAVWALLIAGAAALAHGLSAAHPPEPPAEPEAAGGDR